MESPDREVPLYVMHIEISVCCLGATVSPCYQLRTYVAVSGELGWCFITMQ